jgi:hypothetical protein
MKEHVLKRYYEDPDKMVDDAYKSWTCPNCIPCESCGQKDQLLGIVNYNLDGDDVDDDASAAQPSTTTSTSQAAPSAASAIVSSSSSSAGSTAASSITPFSSSSAPPRDPRTIKLCHPCVNLYEANKYCHICKIAYDESAYLVKYADAAEAAETADSVPLWDGEAAMLRCSECEVSGDGGGGGGGRGWSSPGEAAKRKWFRTGPPPRLLLG